MLWPLFELIGLILWCLFHFFFIKEKTSIRNIYTRRHNAHDIIEGYSNDTVYGFLGLFFLALVIFLMVQFG
jgi:tetrahydromethanopterin S-methyltransferase subunit B